MGRFSSVFYKLQIEEWSTHYIDYNKLKSELNLIKINANNTYASSSSSQQEIANKTSLDEKEVFNISQNCSMNFNNLTMISEEFVLLQSNISSVSEKELTAYFELVKTEIRKFFIFFIEKEKNLYVTLNSFLHHNPMKGLAQYDMEGIDIVIKELLNLISAGAQMSSYAVLNMRSLSMLIKSFDKRFSCKIPKLTYAYIRNFLMSTNKDLLYILQFKLIDELSVIVTYDTDILNKALNQKSHLTNQHKAMKGNIELQIKHIMNTARLIDNDYNRIKEYFSNWIRDLKINPGTLCSNKNKIDNRNNTSELEIKLEGDDKEDDCNVRGDDDDRLGNGYNNNTNKLLDDIIEFDQSETWINETESQLNTNTSDFNYHNNNTALNSQTNESNIYIIFFYSLYYMLSYSSILITNHMAIFRYLNYPKCYTGFILSTTSLGSFASLCIHKLFTNNKYRTAIIISILFILLSHCLYILSIALQNIIIMFISRFTLGLGSNMILNREYLRLLIPKFKAKRYRNSNRSFSMIGVSLGLLLNVVIKLSSLTDDNNLILNYCTVSSYACLLIGIFYCGLILHSFKDPFTYTFELLDITQRIVNPNTGVMAQPLINEDNNKERPSIAELNKKLSELNDKGNFSTCNMVQTAIQSILIKESNKSKSISSSLYIYIVCSLSTKLTIETILIISSYYLLSFGSRIDNIFTELFASAVYGGSILLSFIFILWLNYSIKTMNAKVIIIFICICIAFCSGVLSHFFLDNLKMKYRLMIYSFVGGLMLIMIYSLEMIYNTVLNKLIPYQYCICRITWEKVNDCFIFAIQLLPGIAIGIDAFIKDIDYNKISLFGLIIVLLAIALLLVVKYKDHLREKSLLRLMKCFIL